MTQKRMHNLDILRLVLMSMVIALHFLNQTTAILEEGIPVDGFHIYGTFLRCLCICAVNTFVILSGYLGCDKAFSVERLAERVLMVVFYAVGVYLVCSACGVLTASDVPSYYRMLQLFFPVSNIHYWYFTAYILLYLLTPFLNAGVKALPQKTLKRVLLLLLLFHCFLKSIIPLHFVYDNGGYGFNWFLCLYLIGAYLKCHGLPSWRTGALLYAGSVVLLTVLTVLLHQMRENTGGFRDFAGVTNDYNFVFCLTAAVGLFTMFARTGGADNPAGRLCTRIAPFLPGVYLLHVHQQTDRRWLAWLSPLIGEVRAEEPLLMTVQMLSAILIVLLCGIAADVVRFWLFWCVKGFLKKR